MSTITRRAILGSSLWGTALAAMPRFAIASAAPKASGESKSTAPIVDTTGGKLRGVVVNGVHVYRGIPYGAPTGGANRFMPPRKPGPWTGVRDAFQNGHSSPQVAPAPGAIGWGLRGSAAQSEDCLVLNVFTNGAAEDRKRPVMMWIHGGGSPTAPGHRSGTTAQTSRGSEM